MPAVTRDQKIRLGSGDAIKDTVIWGVACQGLRESWWINQGGDADNPKRRPRNTFSIPSKIRAC